MANVLGQGDLAEEARGPMLEAIHCLSRALAVERRLPEPGTLDHAVQAPLSHCWEQSLPTIRAFVSDATQPWKPAAEALTSFASPVM